jgi:uncharacterized protein YbjT (DUF2867 family)
LVIFIGYEITLSVTLSRRSFAMIGMSKRNLYDRSRKEKKMNLVVGATGILGNEICHLLAAKGRPVRGLVRNISDPAKVEKLKGYGVEVVQGNLSDRASLEAACQGVTAVISTVSSMPFSYQPGQNDIQHIDLDGVKNLIDAARSAGVRRFIYTSFSGGLDIDYPLNNAKRAVEKYLKESGLSYTILRPSYFMEGWLSPMVGFDPANAKATIYGSGENPISWISFRDVALFAVESISNPAARNATLELGGPELLTPKQVVGIFEELGGRPFEVTHVPEAVLEEQQKAAADPMQQSFSGLMRCYALGDPIPMQETLEAFPIQLTSVRDYARQVLLPT